MSDSTDRTFRVDDSFKFAVQIPDNTVGCSGSRCTNCGSKVAYCNHVCNSCQRPFIGPFGFPQLPIWQAMSSDKKQAMVVEIYRRENHGRLMWGNVQAMPLTERELAPLVNLGFHDAIHFISTHGISTGELLDWMKWINKD